MSLRTRLVLVVAAAVAAAVALASALVFFLVRNELRNQVNRSLQAQVDQISNSPGLGVATVAGFLVARAAVAPVRELSDTAERVRSTRDLTQRIHVEGSDELSRLAATFNAMLESLDEAARLQRRLVQDASHELRTPL